VGLADVITRRLYDKIERGATYANVVTSGFLERGKIPVAAASDREAFEIALRVCGPISNGRERIVRILDTLHLEDVYVSRPILDELRNTPSVELIEQEKDLFDDSGSLTPF
jgi:hypothetical protein